MLSRNNEYFENLRKIGEAYETIRKAHEDKKAELIGKFGYDSDEMKAWYEKKKEMTYPVPAGACKAYRAWMHSIEREADEVEMDDFLWDREVKDFVEALRGAGIESFVYTNASTALMDNIHDLEANGWKMTGLAEIRNTSRWATEEFTRGLRFEAR